MLLFIMQMVIVTTHTHMQPSLSIQGKFIHGAHTHNQRKADPPVTKGSAGGKACWYRLKDYFTILNL